MSDWDDEDTDDTPQQDKSSLLSDYLRTTTQIETLTQVLAEMKLQILADFPASPGEYTATHGDHGVIVTIPEAWSWDSEKLDKIVGGAAPAPQFVKRKTSIDKRAFQTLSVSEQDTYLDALTRKPGAARIKITKWKGG